MSSKEAEARQRIIMFVDQPSIFAMEKHRHVGVSPRRLRELGSDLGDLVYWSVLVDRRITDDEANKWNDSGFDVSYCPRIRVKSRSETADAPRSSYMSKETIDFMLIERVHRMVAMFKPDQVILVIGDCDYIPLLRSLVFDYRVNVRLFLTAESKIGSVIFGERLLSRHLLYEDRHFTYPIQDMTAFRTVPTTKELHRVGPEAMTELFMHSEESILCTSCEEPVPIGLLKLHKCHPNPLLQMVSCPICRNKVPYADWTEHPCHNIERVTNGDGTITLLERTGETKSVPPVLPRLTMDADRLEELRASVLILDGSPDLDQLVGTLRKAPSTEALHWLIRKKRDGRQDATTALARAMKAPDAFITHWVNTLLHIRDELADQYQYAEAKKLISSWMNADVSWEAIALLIQEDVLKTDGQGNVQRGSLMHPVYQLLRTISQYPATA